MRIALSKGFIILWLSIFALPSWPSDFKVFQGLNNPDVFQIKAAQLDRPFNIIVRVPQGYQSDGPPLPTLYLLDGGHTFPMLASYYQYLAFAEEAPDIIIVGISYGADAFQDGNFRGTDFTAKAVSRAHYGGAPKFQSFLKNDLMPYIEGNYNSDSSKRMIFGQSLGGQFVLYTAQTQPSLFWGHIASNPALHRNLNFFLQNNESSLKTDSFLFVSSGTEDNERFRVPALQWISHWQVQSNKPWQLKTDNLEGHGHFSAAPVAFRNAIRWFFDKKID